MIEQGKLLQQRYRIDKQIGQGGMGAVYVATDERFGSVVAIKETLFMDDNYRKALEREARLLNSLKHAALPRVSDHFLEDNGQFIVMEYIPGEDLSFILDQTGKPFSFTDVQKWAVQLLDALEFLHTQSTPVIHRDIKPQNLKLTAHGQIVLLDFGLAKGNPTDAGFHTAAKSIFGYSRNYASLEQIQGTGTDPRSDLYSLAATLYHLATGQPPEDALTRAMSVLSNQPDPLVPASTINPDVPAGFAGVLQKALELNAASRPASAADMKQMLADMGAYAYLAADASTADTVANADPGSQKTRLMPGLTNQAVDRQTGIKTEVLPAYISQQTAVRTNGEASGSESSIARSRSSARRFAMAGAASLLIVGGMALGAYVYDPSIFSPANSDEPITVTTVETQSAVPPEAAPASDLVVPEASPSIESAAKDTGTKADAERTQSKQTAKMSKSAPSNKNETDLDMTDEDVKINGKTIYVGNMKIKNGRIETPDSFIDENGVTPKTPSIPPTRPVRMPDMRNLTPAQRRKMQELRRRGLVPPEHRVPKTLQ
ncbi:MAG: serine/threonine protein kinase [Acidobacteria bacterium]|nr:serine/threonine protein kinase [Acidobacteriota bacterium]